MAGVSELTGKFLTQLRQDIELLASDGGPAGDMLMQLAQRMDIDEEPSDLPLTLDSETKRLTIHAKNKAVDKLLNNPHRRRSDLLFFVSSMMSLLNREEEIIEDIHEREFHKRLLKFALEESQGSWAGAV